ncbi:MAG TPA: hypothetical protein VFS23_14805 [Vicinamibacterales bacterium]|nr:hypothetical protein [Vicinamibacterales bacterium]
MKATAGLFSVLLLVTAAAPALAQSPRFYPDDPLRTEPTPLPVTDVNARSLSEVLEHLKNSVRKTGERHPANGVIVSRAVNTLGEVMDGDWYVNRHAARRMTIEELQRGPGNTNPPALTAPWQVLVVKTFGVNPGLLVADSKNQLYLLRFDPYGYEGLATGAEMVTSRLFYALGYHVPENYIVSFARPQLVANPEGQAVSSSGRPRGLLATDIDLFLRRVPVGADQAYRAVATRLPEGRGSLLGPFQVWGVRRDDPNDTVPHEHRRDLRGLSVFESWVNNANARAVGTQDILTTVDGIARIRHYLVDFTKSLGSGSQDGPKLSWEGNEPNFPGLSKIGHNIAGMGVVTPAWMKAKYPGLREVGAFEASTFNPEGWTTNHSIAPFANRLPDDTFWAARQVMAFTDEEIRAIVQTGQYSKEAEDWITAALIERRNRIGRAFFARVLPLDGFRVTPNALEFDDLNVTYGFTPARTYEVEWYGFDNARDMFLDRIGTGTVLPAATQSIAAGSYIAARIHAGDPATQVQVFLRKGANAFEVVGLERTWAGKVSAVPPPPVRAGRRVFADLTPQQRVLFETYVKSYNESRGSQYTAEQSFDRLTISEQTTFYGVTHALMNSRLTDAQGASLGTALDRVEAIERIAGQYAGRGGDEQFRLYVSLKPDTRDVLGKSREFFRDHENTVYHVGYPHSFRQVGKEPNIQFSMSEDGLRADIDVDYRASKTPQSMFNGHLTSANSDIRVGENANRHGVRWTGLITWWQSFGRLAEALPDQPDLLNMDRPDAPSTPLPADRPSGAAPDRVEDAVQEFLTDWLVRQQYDQALQFLSPRAYACLTLDEEAQGRVLDAASSRRELRRIMEYSAGKLGKHSNLSSVVIAFTPRDPKRVVLEHTFRREFLLTPLTEAQARPYLCDAGTAAPTGVEYFGAVFQFRTAGGSLFGLLWTREEGQWKLVSYRPLNP